jgi:hypothetical protein
LRFKLRVEVEVGGSVAGRSDLNLNFQLQL